MLKLWKNSLWGVCTGVVAGAAFLLQAGVADAATLHPGAGNAKPKNPEWNIKNDKNSSSNTNQTSGVKKLENKNNTSEAVLNVLLADDVKSAEISALGNYEIVNSDGDVLASFNTNKTAKITMSDTYIAINGKKTKAHSVMVVPNADEGYLRYDDIRYRGTLNITADNNRLKVVNNLSLEDYVKGVLPAEMTPDWHTEALKAQAVAARTFALYNKDKRPHGYSNGYDLCSDTHCQSYSGMVYETEASNNAVDATYGQAMYYNNKPIYAAFHASSGGATENSEDVWGTYLAYLRSVTDDDSKSPYHNWTKTFTVSEVQNKLKAADKNIGTLKSITMVPDVSSAVTGRTPSGREYSVQFAGSKNRVTLNGEEARNIFDLRSGMFNVSTERIVDLPTTSNSKKTSDTDKEKTEKSTYFGSTPSAMMGSVMKVSGKEKIIFNGHGYGHGLGLAQYGARAMAEKGNKYDVILHHYYTDVTIQEIY